MVRYPDDLSLLEARNLFFRVAKLGSDGGYRDRWVRVETKPIPFYFPNWPARVAAARLHDLHHIAAEYETDWPGEAEIAAWEIASGCARYHAAWVLNLGGFGAGLVVAPRRLFRAFLRGHRAKTNLYKAASMNRGLMISRSECCAINSGCARRFHRPVPPTLGCSFFGASRRCLPGCRFRYLLSSSSG
jgi:hypothetical protein